MMNKVKIAILGLLIIFSLHSCCLGGIQYRDKLYEISNPVVSLSGEVLIIEEKSFAGKPPRYDGSNKYEKIIIDPIQLFDGANDLKRYLGAPHKINSIDIDTEGWKYKLSLKWEKGKIYDYPVDPTKNWGYRWNGFIIIIPPQIPLPFIIPLGSDNVNFIIKDNQIISVELESSEDVGMCLFGFCLPEPSQSPPCYKSSIFAKPQKILFYGKLN